MSADPDFAAYCAELLGSAGGVRSKRMFGGYGFYIDELFVAIIMGDALYLKADEQSQLLFHNARSSRFEHTRQGKQQGMGFWTAPAEAMDSPNFMRPWVQLAIDSALRARWPATAVTYGSALPHVRARPGAAIGTRTSSHTG